MLWALRLLDLHYIHLLCSNSFTCDKLCTALLAFPATPLLPWLQDPSLWYVEVVLSKISIALSIRMTFIYLPTVPVLKATNSRNFSSRFFCKLCWHCPKILYQINESNYSQFIALYIEYRSWKKKKKQQLLQLFSIYCTILNLYITYTTLNTLF